MNDRFQYRLSQPQKSEIAQNLIDILRDVNIRCDAAILLYNNVKVCIQEGKEATAKKDYDAMFQSPIAPSSPSSAVSESLTPSSSSSSPSFSSPHSPSFSTPPPSPTS